MRLGRFALPLLSLSLLTAGLAGAVSPTSASATNPTCSPRLVDDTVSGVVWSYVIFDDTTLGTCDWTNPSMLNLSWVVVGGGGSAGGPSTGTPVVPGGGGSGAQVYASGGAIASFAAGNTFTVTTGAGADGTSGGPAGSGIGTVGSLGESTNLKIPNIGSGVDDTAVGGSGGGYGSNYDDSQLPGGDGQSDGAAGGGGGFAQCTSGSPPSSNCYLAGGLGASSGIIYNNGGGTGSDSRWAMFYGSYSGGGAGAKFPPGTGGDGNAGGYAASPGTGGEGQSLANFANVVGVLGAGGNGSASAGSTATRQSLYGGGGNSGTTGPASTRSGGGGVVVLRYQAPGPPSAPTFSTITAGNTQVTVTWSAPSNNGGSSILSYVLAHGTSASGPWTIDDSTVGGTSKTVTNLANGMAYWFKVAATNGLGTGAEAITASSTTPRTTPDQPTSLSGTPGNGQALLTWTAPVSNGGSAITGYKVEKRDGVGGWTDDTTNTGSASTSYTVVGLTNGHSYTFRVSAINAAGNSTSSGASSPVVPAAGPTITTEPTDDTKVVGQTATFTVAASGLGSLTYQWEVKLSGGSWASVVSGSGGTSATYTTAPLASSDDSAQYRAQVTDSLGTTTSEIATLIVLSPPTPPSPIAPGPPINVNAIPGNGIAVVSWSPPVDSGSYPVSSYRVVASPGGASCFSMGPSCTVTGLRNGTSYTFTVTALSGAGWGAASADSAPVTPTTEPTPAPEPVPVPSLPPGSSQLVVEGVPQQVVVDSNLHDNGLNVTADDFTMNLQGLGTGGAPLNLAPDGALILNSDRQVRTSGTGFLANSKVDLYLDPATESASAARVRWVRAAMATYVGTVVTDTGGSFSGKATLPAGVSVGDHVLQAVGWTKTGATRALSLGVRVLEPVTITLIKGKRAADGQHDRITATGTSTGIEAGEKLIPFIRYSGRSTFEKGKALISVQADGTFTWTRQVKKSKDLTAYVAYIGVQSNRVTWKAIR